MLGLPRISSRHDLPAVQFRLYSEQIGYSCCGLLYVGPQNGVFYLTLFLICGTMGLFFGFDAPYLTRHVSILMPVVAGFLLVIVLSCLMRCAFMDPGIVPRSTLPEYVNMEKEAYLDAQRTAAGAEDAGGTSPIATVTSVPRSKEINVNGHPVVLKFCATCRIFRPPRSSHCSICDSCIMKFDHHCPWVGNCVGQRNYRYFYLFLITLSLLCVFVFACVVIHLLEITRKKNFADAVQESPASLVVGLICFFSVWSVLGLAGFHTYLVSSNQTTNEDIKGTFSKKRRSAADSSPGPPESTPNPYKLGNIFKSYFVGLFEPQHPSLIRPNACRKEETIEICCSSFIASKVSISTPQEL